MDFESKRGSFQEIRAKNSAIQNTFRGSKLLRKEKKVLKFSIKMRVLTLGWLTPMTVLPTQFG